MNNMLHYTHGNLLESPAIALVNAVNTQGVMGKGLALAFRQAFPHNYREYRKACAAGQLVPGNLLVVWDTTSDGIPKRIINFPTKTAWRQPSRYEYVESGLEALARLIATEQIPNIAVPALGCGLGGLEWSRVHELIERYLSKVNAEVWVFEPLK